MQQDYISLIPREVIPVLFGRSPGFVSRYQSSRAAKATVTKIQGVTNFNNTFSSGYCSGISPDSLFIVRTDYRYLQNQLKQM
jgi:hypothetical protein